MVVFGVWAAPGGFKTIQRGGGLRPPPFWMVLKPPGAAQTPKTIDFQPNPKPPSAKPPSGNRRCRCACPLYCAGHACPAAASPPPRRRGLYATREVLFGGCQRGDSSRGGFWVWLTIGRFRSLGGPGVPGTPLDRPGPPRTSTCTKNQPRKPILRPFRGGLAGGGFWIWLKIVRFRGLGGPGGL